MNEIQLGLGSGVDAQALAESEGVSTPFMTKLQEGFKKLLSKKNGKL